MNRALIVLGLVLILVSVFGCASFGQDRWHVNHTMKPAVTYEWIETSGQAETTQKCPLTGFYAPQGSYALACAMRLQVGPKGLPHCVVVSHIDEETAKSYQTYGGEWGNLWRHEMRHCGLIDGVVYDHD